MDFELDGGRPGDERGFIHKKLLGGIKLPGILGIGASLVGSLVGRGRTVPRTQTARPTRFSEAEKQGGRRAKFGDSGGGRVLGAEVGSCPRGFRPDFITGVCEPAAGQVTGDAVMGRYGAGLAPGSMMIDRAVCLRGMQLGDDGICYNKSQISNKQRMWPAGRKPLLTGGDMRAISTAARAGRRLEGATKRLQRMGMMKKPTSRRRLPAGRGRQVLIESGPGSVVA